MNPGSLVVLMCKAQVRWEGTGLLHEPGEPDGAGVQCTVHSAQPPWEGDAPLHGPGDSVCADVQGRGSLDRFPDEH